MPAPPATCTASRSASRDAPTDDSPRRADALRREAAGPPPGWAALRSYVVEGVFRVGPASRRPRAAVRRARPARHPPLFPHLDGGRHVHGGGDRAVVVGLPGGGGGGAGAWRGEGWRAGRVGARGARGRPDALTRRHART